MGDDSSITQQRGFASVGRKEVCKWPRWGIVVLFDQIRMAVRSVLSPSYRKSGSSLRFSLHSAEAAMLVAVKTSRGASYSSSRSTFGVQHRGNAGSMLGGGRNSSQA
jgi:hypothetical protein